MHPIAKLNSDTDILTAIEIRMFKQIMNFKYEIWTAIQNLISEVFIPTPPKK